MPRKEDAIRGGTMKITVTLDEKLVKDAMEYTGVQGKTAVIRYALKEVVAWEAMKRLAAAGGSDPTATAGPRRRWEVEER
jgi:Arc/MetJ family transcription regulator